MAGTEAAFYLASHGVEVVLAKSKRVAPNPAQKIKDFAELVCTNSLKSINETTGHGLLKYEMKALGSLVLGVANDSRVPAGDALAVDRVKFSELITKQLTAHPLVTILEQDVQNPEKLRIELGCDHAIVATGPLTTSGLSEWIKEIVSDDDLYFYDAIAPVVDSDSLDYSKLYLKDRHHPHSKNADYLNAPMNQEEYENFVNELVEADKVPAQNFEKYQFFEACLPVDLMAERGIDTPRFSCMKPIGLEQKDGELPYAVVQLRKENLLGSALNMVGFQNRLKYSEQVRVFKMIPGFENASFFHLGSVHRNTFLNAGKVLNHDLTLKTNDKISFAGQIIGVEGYTESASMGLYVAYNLLRKLQGKRFQKWPVFTTMGALVNYVMTCEKPAPSNINFGLLPSMILPKQLRKFRSDKKILKKIIVSERAKLSFDQFMQFQKDENQC